MPAIIISVEHIKDDTLVDLIFALAEIFIVVSCIFRDMLILRVLIVTGMLGYLVGAITAGYHEPGMRALIVFSAMTVIINLFQIIRLITDRIPILVPDEVKDIYLSMFATIVTRDFLELYKLSEKKHYVAGDIIAKEDQPVTALIAINKGSVSINKKGKTITTLGPGYFVGEISALTGGTATATAVAEGPLDCIIWSKEVINKLADTNPELYNKLKQDFVLNLIKKINESKSVSSK